MFTVRDDANIIIKNTKIWIIMTNKIDRIIRYFRFEIIDRTKKEWVINIIFDREGR